MSATNWPESAEAAANCRERYSRDNSSFASPYRVLAGFQMGKLAGQGKGNTPVWAARFLD